MGLDLEPRRGIRCQFPVLQRLAREQDPLAVGQFHGVSARLTAHTSRFPRRNNSTSGGESNHDISPSPSASSDWRSASTLR
ncbi:MAG: hypothetical protein ACJ72I_00640, partial [Pseudonocardiaceae bacterium]